MTRSNKARTRKPRARSQSKSPLIEKIAVDLRGRSELEELASRMNVYYDSLSEALLEEDESWGELGESALASVT